MDNKTMLEGILWDLKALGDLFLHGSIESGTVKVHQAFKDSLNEVLNLQNELYLFMSENGMYTVSNVTEKKKKKVKNKYAENLEEE